MPETVSILRGKVEFAPHKVDAERRKNGEKSDLAATPERTEFRKSNRPLNG